MRRFCRLWGRIKLVLYNEHKGYSGGCARGLPDCCQKCKIHIHTLYIDMYVCMYVFTYVLCLYEMLSNILYTLLLRCIYIARLAH